LEMMLGQTTLNRGLLFGARRDRPAIASTLSMTIALTNWRWPDKRRLCVAALSTFCRPAPIRRATPQWSSTTLSPSRPISSDPSPQWTDRNAARRRVVIAGAAGRDFHDFNVVFRNNPGIEVVAFTAAQIPGISGRRYPPPLLARSIQTESLSLPKPSSTSYASRAKSMRWSSLTVT
jgi:hypothetical protein